MMSEWARLEQHEKTSCQPWCLLGRARILSIMWCWFGQHHDPWPLTIRQKIALHLTLDEVPRQEMVLTSRALFAIHNMAPALYATRVGKAGRKKRCRLIFSEFLIFGCTVGTLSALFDLSQPELWCFLQEAYARFWIIHCTNYLLLRPLYKLECDL